MFLRAAVLALALATLPAFSQTASPKSGLYNYSKEFRNQPIPTTSINITTGAGCLVGPNAACKAVVTQTGGADPTPALCSIGLTGTSSQTITLQDGAGNVILNGTVSATSSKVYWSTAWATDATCPSYPGGIYIQASGSGAVMSLVIKWNQ